MRTYVISAITVLALAIGAAQAQSPSTFGVSLAYDGLPLPLPLPGVHAGIDDLLAEGVALRLNLSAIAFGFDGGWFVGGITGADAVWSFPTTEGATLRPYAGGGAGMVFAGGGSGTDLGAETAPHVGVLAGASVPLDGLDVFLEVRGNAALGFFDLSRWSMSIAVGLTLRP